MLYRIQDEIDAVLGGRSEVEYEDLGKLEYFDQVFKEILRLYPVAPGTTRETLEAATIDGHHIPVHSTLFVSIQVLHSGTFKKGEGSPITSRRS